jgi:hypothetical protein
MIRAGLMLLFGSWAPLFVVGVLDSSANPIGLGLLALGGSLVAICVLALGLLVALFRWAR